MKVHLQLIPLLQETSLILFFLPKHGVFLLQFALSQVNARLEVLRPLGVLDPLTLFLLLHLDDIELALDALTSRILLGGGKSFKFVGVSKGVPRGRIGVQNVFHALVFDFHGLFVGNFQRPVFLLFILIRDQLRLGQQSLDNLKALLELIHILLEFLSEIVPQVLVLRMIQVKRRKNQRSQLPVRLAQVLIVAIGVHTIRNSFLLLYHTDEIGDVDLVLLVVCLQVGEHLQFHVDVLLLDGDRGVGAAATPRRELLVVVLISSAKEIIWQADGQRFNHVRLLEELLPSERRDLGQCLMGIMKLLEKVQEEPPLTVRASRVLPTPLLLLLTVSPTEWSGIASANVRQVKARYALH